MGLLGMLAAGGAQGLANASNQNVAAQNQLELENMRAGREDQREALRQKYLERNFNLQRQDRKEQATAQMQYDQLKYQRGRADKAADDELAHGRKMELVGTQEARKDARSANSIAAANQRAANKAAASGSSTGTDDGLPKMTSPVGKATVDIMRLGLADNEHDAYNLALKLDIVRAAQQNPMTKISDDKLLESVQRLATDLLPQQKGKGLLNGGQAQDTGFDFDLDPKTGKLIPNGL